MTYESLLLLPVDMPYLDKKTLNHLLSLADVDVDLIRFEGHQFPIVFNNISKLCKTIEGLKLSCQRAREFVDVESKRYSFKELFKVLNSIELKVENEFCFQNVNTPEEFIAAISKANIAFADRWKRAK